MAAFTYVCLFCHTTHELSASDKLNAMNCAAEDTATALPFADIYAVYGRDICPSCAGDECHACHREFDWSPDAKDEDRPTTQNPGLCPACYAAGALTEECE